MKELIKLLRYLAKYPINILIGIVAMLLQVAAGFAIPYLMAIMIDDAIKTNNLELLYETAGYMLAIAFLGLIAGLINNYNSQKIAIYSSTDLRLDLFAKIQELSFTNIDKFKTSRLITTATNDISRIQMFYQMLFRIVTRAPFMIIVGLVFAISQAPELSQIFYISMPILILSFVVIMLLAFPKFQKVQKTIDGLNKVSLETAKAPRVIKSFVTMDYENKKFEDANELFKETNSAAEKLMAFAEPVIMLIFNATFAGVIMLGAKYIDSGVLLTATGEPATGIIIAFTNYSSQILFGLLMFAMMMIFIARAVVSAKRINEVLDETIDLDNLPDALDDVSLTGAIEFDNVSFGYGKDDSRVIKDISFKVNPGETVGIIGSTGSGKSTLVNLLPRLYDVCEGEVRVNGINVKNIKLETLRSQISVVTQTATIYSGSIGTNIAQGTDNLNVDEFNEAIESASATEFVASYDDFYNHKVEQNGVNLSGGQKQRLSLARAFIRRPKILILDDSTSAVDAKSEESILGAIKKVTKNMTSLIISQKISTIKDMDKILVLSNKGYVDGFGTHEELLKSSEVYQEIALSQIGNGGGLDE